MTTTIDNNNQQIDEALSEADLDAIELKFEGASLKQIAEKLGVAHQTVRAWFMTGGRLQEAYFKYATDEAKRRRAQATDTFNAHLNNAVMTLVAIMSKSKMDIARVQAAKEVINRLMGEPLKVISTDDQKVNEYLEALNKQEDEEETIPRNDTPGKDEHSETGKE